jgi:hypothetical protein
MVKSLKSRLRLGAKNGKQKLPNLRQLNLIASAAFAAQAILIWIFCQPGKGDIPITTNFLSIDKLTSAGSGQTVYAEATRQLFSINLAWIIIAFLAVAAITHLFVATRHRATYEAELANRTNKYRWVEYALAGGLMVVAIAMLVGIYDFATLLALFVMFDIACLMGWVLETQGWKPKKPAWPSFKITAAADAAVWLIIGLYVWGAHVWGSAVPGYVYWVAGTMFIAFHLFALIAINDRKKEGQWADYLRVEQSYITLSLVTKSALAWQIFAGAL